MEKKGISNVCSFSTIGSMVPAYITAFVYSGIRGYSIVSRGGDPLCPNS